ncbi:aromatic acid/H+ symport family MFS transporter [Paraburkholderia panacisoli]|uniref:Aromatic acid/H+ symport family MFS transporter n=1 Tax=Paraburkholderia panacisoli TaxID=2603818 RepID=A0A5B0GQN2_9BURK|nr:MFS transporter [Paraburkholderia panacisoli]KAA1004869.1 aromatic acid/H+ symport family MFS transporter [Paraburkholderia panacisoli]
MRFNDAGGDMRAADLMNGNGISRLQVAVLVYCLLIVTIDGFDTASVGYLASSLRGQWSMQTASMGKIFGAGMLGLMIGCFLFGPVADRIGRKKVLIASVVFFGCGSVASGFAQSPEQMALLRLLTGLGLGGAMPNVITLSSNIARPVFAPFLLQPLSADLRWGSRLAAGLWRGSFLSQAGEAYWLLAVWLH